jgi:polyferredoxin
MKAAGRYEEYAKAGAGGGKLQLHDQGGGHEMFHIHGAGDMGGEMMLMKGVTPASPRFMVLLFSVFTVLTLAFLYLFDRRGGEKDKTRYPRLDLFRVGIIKRVFKSRPLQFILQLPVVILFIVVIVTGILGDQNPGRNFATVATWTVWWGGVMFVILLFGAGWCLVCPWSAMSDWIERLSFWKRKKGISQGRKWPRALKSRHTMTVFFIVVTWMELGVFITYNPRYTSIFAFLMFVLILVTALLYERKTFCRYICFMGGIIGVYSNQAPLEVRSREASVCEACKTKDCMRGNEKGYPCPIFEYPGGMDRNTNCILCTECFKTCPHDNMTLNVRPPFIDFSRGYKGRYDEAVLAMTLLGLTIYHGFTMLPLWFGWAIETLKVNYPLYIGVFTLLLTAFVVVPIGIHYIVSWLTRLISGGRGAGGAEVTLKEIFVQYSYAFLPVAFFYHLAHNISHLNMEGLKILPVLSDPFGWGWDLFGTAGSKASMVINMGTTRDLQFVFVLVGLVVGLFLSYRFSLRLFGERGRALVAMLPMAAAILAYSFIDMLALILPMVMRTVSYF